MRIYLELSSALIRYAQGNSVFELAVAPGSTVAEALAQAGIPEEAWGLLAMNRQKVNPDRVLQEDDRVMVLPPIMGG